MNLKRRILYTLAHLMAFLPDTWTLRIQYLIRTGHILHLDKPKRFTEKLQHYKAYYRNPVMKQCVDKYAVRDYVAKALGTDKYLNTLYQLCERAEDIDFDACPTSSSSRQPTAEAATTSLYAATSGRSTYPVSSRPSASGKAKTTLSYRANGHTDRPAVRASLSRNTSKKAVTKTVPSTTTNSSATTASSATSGSTRTATPTIGAASGAKNSTSLMDIAATALPSRQIPSNCPTTSEK